MSYLKAIESRRGCHQYRDISLCPAHLTTRHRTIVVALYGTDRDTGLDVEQILKVAQMLESDCAQVPPTFLDTSSMSAIDAGVLVHQIPGHVVRNWVIATQQANARR